MLEEARLYKGLRDGCLGTDVSMHERFRLAHAGGFEGIELTLPAEGRYSLQATSDDRSELKKLADDGMPILCMNAGIPWQSSPSAMDPTVRRVGQELVRHAIDLAADLNVDTLLYIPGTVTADASFSSVWDAAREATETLLPQAEAAGVTLAVENVWNALILSPRDMLEFVDGFHSSFVRVYFDVGNVMQFGFPHHWIQALGSERIARVHVKDFNVRPGGWLGFTQLLHGDVDWLLTMQALKNVGYTGWVTPEVSPSRVSPDVWIAELSAAMDAILALYNADPDKDGT